MVQETVHGGVLQDGELDEVGGGQQGHDMRLNLLLEGEFLLGSICRGGLQIHLNLFLLEGLFSHTTLDTNNDFLLRTSLGIEFTLLGLEELQLSLQLLHGGVKQFDFILRHHE